MSGREQLKKPYSFLKLSKNTQQTRCVGVALIPESHGKEEQLSQGYSFRGQRRHPGLVALTFAKSIVNVVLMSHHGDAMRMTGK